MRGRACLTHSFLYPSRSDLLLCSQVSESGANSGFCRQLDQHDCMVKKEAIGRRRKKRKRMSVLNGMGGERDTG